MKYLKLYEDAEPGEYRYKYGISDYTINPDDTIDVFQKVDLNCQGLTEIPYTFGDDYDIIQDDTLILDRLNDFLEEIGYHHKISNEWYNRLEKNYKII